MSSSPVRPDPPADAVNALRVLSLDQVQAAGIGHIGLPLSMAPVVYTLFTRHLIVDPDDPEWENRDRFVLSCGHGSALLYSALHLSGFELTVEDLAAFRSWESKTPGHPEWRVTPGVDATTGPLGQGVANAVGMAIAESMAGARLSSSAGPLIDHRVFVLASDGDLMEGVAMEAMALAGRLRLGKLIVIYDDNDVVIDGRAAVVHDADGVVHALESLGWHISEPVDGEDISAIDAAIQAAKQIHDRPSLIHVRSVIGYGSTLADSSAIHSGAVSDEEAGRIRESLGWRIPEPFVVPDEVHAEWSEVGRRGRAEHQKWEQRLNAPENAVIAEQLRRWQRPFDPQEVRSVVASVPLLDAPEAGRASGGRVLAALAARFDNIVGGSADLASATMAVIPDGGVYGPDSPEGRNIAYGIREHAMGAISNGIALHGLFRPFASTFMMFATYQSNAMRMAALQELPVVHVLTHDSIGVGEDGPTHQPIEVFAALRATPNTVVFRPSDARETAAAWAEALVRVEGPTVLALSRAAMSQRYRVDHGDPGRGASVLRAVDDAQIDLVASGTEVDLAERAQEILGARGVRAQVISVTSHEAFAFQEEAYRHSILAPRRPRLVIEASASVGLQGLAGHFGATHGIDRFGASAPPSVLFEKLGFRPEDIVEAAVRLLSEREGSRA